MVGWEGIRWGVTLYPLFIVFLFVQDALGGGMDSMDISRAF